MNTNQAYYLETVDVDDDAHTTTFEEVPHYEVDDPDDFTGVFSSIQGETPLPSLQSASGTRKGGASAAAEGSNTSDVESKSALETTEMSVEDFIRNFLVAHDMKRSLDAFQTEWFQLQRNASSLKTALPRIFQQYEELQKEMSVLKQAAATSAAVATEAKNTWAKLRRERDEHRMHHRRLVQEKNDLLVDIKRLTKHVSEYQPTLDSLQKKYEQAMKDRMLMKLERAKLQQQIQSLQEQVSALTGEPIPQTRSNTIPKPSGTSSSVPSSQSSSSSSSTSASTSSSNTSSLSTTSHKTKSSTGSTATAATAASLARANAVALSATANAASSSLNQPLTDKFTKVGDNFAHLLPPATNPHHSNPPKVFSFTNAVLAHSFKAHKLGVPGIALSSTSPVVATTSDDMKWKLWSVPRGELIMTGEGHKSWLSACSFHPSGSIFATAGADHMVKVWDLAEQRCAAKLAGHTQPVWDVQFHHGGHVVLTASMDQTARLWDLHTGLQLHSYRGHLDSVNKVRWVPYSSLFVTASGDKTLSVWDAKSGLCVQSIFGHNNAVQALDVDVTGRFIVSGDADGVVKVWDLQAGSLQPGQERFHIDAGRGASINAVKFDHSATSLVVATDAGQLDVYSLKGAVATYSGAMQSQDASPVQELVVGESGEYAVGGTADGSVLLWRL